MSGDHSIADGGGPETAPAATYDTDPAIFERGKARIVFQTWQYAGQLSQVAEPSVAGPEIALDSRGVAAEDGRGHTKLG